MVEAALMDPPVGVKKASEAQESILRAPLSLQGTPATGDKGAIAEDERWEVFHGKPLKYAKGPSHGLVMPTCPIGAREGSGQALCERPAEADRSST